MTDSDKTPAARVDLDAIRVLANAATPGPWTVVPGLESPSMPETVRRHYRDEQERRFTAFICGQVNEPLDARFIAALSPDVALALIAEIKSLRAAVQRVRELHVERFFPGHGGGPITVCPQCTGIELPCPTLRALAAPERKDDTE